MIDRYYEMLKGVIAKYPGHANLVDCRSAVGEIGEWFDELHPRNAGFARVADRFRQAINRAYKLGGVKRSSKEAKVI